MSKSLAFPILLLVALSASPAKDGPKGQQAEHPIPVGIVELIANPEKYNGKLVGVVGFLNLNWEGDLLYAHQEDCEHAILSNALGVEHTKQIFQNREKLDMNYVNVVGVFRRRDKSYLPSLGGELTDIRRCEVWSQLSYPRSRKIKDMLKHHSKQQ